MKSLEQTWNKFLENNFPSHIQLLKSARGHRVYKLKDLIIKIDLIDKEKNLLGSNLKNEFTILKILDKTNYNLNPKFKKIDNWELLEIDYIEGDLLELSPNKEKISLKIFWKILLGLWVVSLKGIKYKQFRGRHIIKLNNNEIKFIDFGSSEISSPISSLFYNFKLFFFKERKIYFRGISSIFIFNFIKKK